MKPVIQVEGISKRFQIGRRRESYRTLRESLGAGLRQTCDRIRRRASRASTREDGDFWGLKEVSFDVRPGEVVGLIGRNGAGKSTLLKILSQIIEPTKGRAIVRGRIGSLLEVGTGFHNELTGRENIYLNGSILGMRRKEIDRKFDEIVSFAEMDKFLDTPVKRYSSGMYVRLAFAVAAHLELETLLVDEVLAVGDLEFQKKCLQRMGKVAECGRTVIFVSHNLGIIHRLCDRAILLRDGQLAQDGPSDQVIKSYLDDNRSHDGVWEQFDNHQSGKVVALRKALIQQQRGSASGIVNSDESFRILIEYDVCTNIPNFEIGVQLRNSEGTTILTSLDSDTGSWVGNRNAGRYRSACTIPANLLSPGTYFLTCAAHVINQQTYDTQHDVLAFEVSETGSIRTKRNDRRTGVISPVFEWCIDRID